MIKYHLFQTLKNVVRVNLLIFGQAKLSLMTVWKCSTIRKKNTFSFFASFFRRILGLKGDFFTVGWWFSTNQWFKNQNYISGSKQDSNHISIFIVASSYLQILALHFWCMRSCSSQFKEEGKNLKGYHQKIAYKKEMTFWNKKYRINFCFLLRSS